MKFTIITPMVCIMKKGVVFFKYPAEKEALLVEIIEIENERAGLRATIEQVCHFISK